jgi:predicted dehydrogenase
MTSPRPLPLRVGIIGAGWAGETHLKAFAEQGCTIVAVADPRADRLRELAARYNVATYTDFADLLARDDIDIVSVATPNSLHMPATVAALNSGRHVLCEKPLALNPAEAQQMVNAARANNRVLKVAFSHRVRGDVQTLKQQIDSGALGRIYHAKASWMRRSGIPGMGGWFTTKATAGGGPLIDLGVHVLDMAMYLMGEPEVISVTAATYDELGKRGIGSRGDTVDTSRFEVEDFGTAFIRLAGGATLLLEASWAIYGKTWDDFSVAVFGTHGGGEVHTNGWRERDTLELYVDVGDAPAVVRPMTRRGEGHYQVVRDMLAVIASGDFSREIGLDGLRRTQIIDACYRSAAEGREIVIEPLE